MILMNFCRWTWMKSIRNFFWWSHCIVCTPCRWSDTIWQFQCDAVQRSNVWCAQMSNWNVSTILFPGKLPISTTNILGAMFRQTRPDWLKSEREKQAKNTIDNRFSAYVRPGSPAEDGAIRLVAGITLCKLSPHYTKPVQQYQGTADRGRW